MGKTLPVNEVTIYRDGGRAYPAVNVKDYRPLPFYAPARFPSIDEAFPGFPGVRVFTDDERQAAWDRAAESCWDEARGMVTEILGDGATLLQLGRSGGWAAVDGLPPVEDWDRATRRRWAQWVEYCDHLQGSLITRVYWYLASDLWEPEEEAREARDAAMVRMFGHPHPTNEEAADALLGPR